MSAASEAVSITLALGLAWACAVDEEPGGSTSTGPAPDDDAQDAGSEGEATAPAAALCGDGVVDDGEDCEPGLAGPACASDCSFEPGALLWRQRYNGSSDAGDFGYGVAVTPDGGALVVGDSYVEGEGSNLWLARYEADGAPRWSTTFNGEAGEAYQDAGRGVALGAGGEIYVTGFSYRQGSGFDVLVASFDPDGALAWSARHDGPASGLDMGEAIVVDSFDEDGELLVVGTVDAGPDAHDDMWIARLRADGELKWSTRYDHGVGGNDRGYGIARAPGSGFAVTGAVEVGSEGQLAGGDAWLGRFDSSGALLWSTTHSGAQGEFGYDAGLAVSVDPGDGALVVAGYDSPAAESSDIWIARYDPDGALLWTRTYNEETSDSNMAYALAHAEDGAIVAAGFRLRMNEGEDVWVRKYTRAGEVVWTQTHDDAGYYDIARGVAIDPAGRVLVAGFSFAESTGHDGWLGAFAL